MNNAPSLTGRSFTGIPRLAIAVLGLLCIWSANAAQATAEIIAPQPVPIPGPRPCATFYVSKACASLKQDGRSWKTAWSDFDRINWKKIKPGSTILVDGGQKRMVYTAPLVINRVGAPGKPVRILAARAKGRNGNVVLDGRYRAGSGITIGNYSHVVVSGLNNPRFKRRFQITRFAASGVNVNGWYSTVTLSGLNVHHNGRYRTGLGLVLSQGQKVTVSNCTIHDNWTTNILVAGNGAQRSQFILNRNWIHNGATPGPVAAASESSSLTRPFASGITFAGSTYTTIANSVIGPGLGDGVALTYGRPQVSLQHCLLLNNENSNIKLSTQTAKLSANRITSFMAPYNITGQTHDAISSVKGANLAASNSIFYGGNINVVCGGMIGTGNFQFRTTGNTVVISPEQVDPRFKTDLDALGKIIPARKAATVRFGLRDDSPAKGKAGSAMVAVRQLFFPFLKAN